MVQALALGTPAHAAIATALPLVDGGPRRLVHGVFGTLMRRGATLPDPPSLPAEVAARWQAAWGVDMVARAAEAIAQPPPIDIAFPPDTPPDFEGTSLMPGHLRLARGTAIAGLAGYGPESAGGSSRWWVQDISASIPARLLGIGPGRTALDLCAAPGGKTMQLAAAGFAVTALDASESRLARLSANLERTGLAATVVRADVMTWRPERPADAVLLDAPCSATGIFRRHPDVLHRARPRVIADLARGQQAMLRRAADWVKPGGTMVYSVCSLEPEEGEAVAEAFLGARGDFEIMPVAQDEAAPGMAPSERGWLRILPGVLAAEGGADGFFIARFRRK